MSRIGKKPVEIPAGVKITKSGNIITVKGTKGELSREMLLTNINLEIKPDSLIVTRENDSPNTRALHGLTRQLIYNMVRGVSEGFSKTLQIVGVGYRAIQEGSNVNLNIGFSHPVVLAPPAGITYEVPKGGTQIIISGINNEQVGQIAADIRKIRPPEPYKGKGIRYIDEKIVTKVGKRGK